MNQAEAKRRQAEAFSDILMFVTIYVLGGLTGDNGITYTAVAVQACTLFWIMISGSLSDALGKLLRARKNKGQYRNIARMRGSAMLFVLVLGLAGSLVLAALSGVVADKLFRIPYSRLILLAMSPVVALRSVSSVLEGYFQGEGAELPRPIAGILRQVFLLGFGILFCHLVGGYGDKVSSLLRQENFSAMYGGLGIALAVSLSELLVVLLLGLIYKGSRRFERKAKQEGMYATDSHWDCARYLYSARWPQCLTGLCAFLPFVLGLVFVGRKGEAGGQMAVEYGLYVGKYLVACGIAAAALTIFIVPIIARIFQCFKREENRFARTVFQCGVHFGLVHGIFLTVFVAVLGEQIVDFLHPVNEQMVAEMLQRGSALILLAPLCVYFARILHSMGKRYLVLAAVCGTDVIFVMTVLLSMGKAGILSLVYGGLAGAGLLCALLGVLAYRQMRVRPDWLGVFAVPLGAGGVAGLMILLIRKAFSAHLGSLAILITAFLAAGLVYWIMLLLLRNFKEQELEAVPGGNLISKLGQLLKVF